jgi:arabinogalactan oligomer/maltooligosaccharide transport system permease protein
VLADYVRGNFVDGDGEVLQPGWQAGIGLDNYRSVIETAGRGGLLSVLVWNIAFAGIGTLLTFAVGTFIAVALNAPRMRSRTFYRTLMILPYAFPFFLSGLVWSGLLNPSFGFVNQTLLQGADIDWLGDPWLARLSVIMLSLWFGYPYFFLVSTGALQAIPSDVIEAARVDGATGLQSFRRVQFPLLLSATAPLLVAGFVFSFNDFNSIFMLTGGGPPNLESEVGAGQTDILISLVFKKAFTAESRNFGVASAYSMVLFVLIAIMAIYLFRRTKRLETVYE